MALKHHLSMAGYNINPSIVTLNADNEYKFSDIMIRFAKEMESDIRLRRCPYKIGICDYIAKNASVVIGGKKERVEEELNRIVNMLDFSNQSPQIELYNWILSQNFNIRLVSLHNKILAKLRT